MKPVILENGKSINVQEIRNSKIVGTKEEVNSEDWGDAARSLARRSKGSGKPTSAVTPSKLPEIENKSLEERLAEYGLA